MNDFSRTYNFRRRILDKMPAGIATGPFEFATAVGYFLTVINAVFNSRERLIVQTVLFPGDTFWLWIGSVGLATVGVVIGQLLTAYRPRRGLIIERAGLLLLSAGLLSYFYAIYARNGSVSTTLETTGWILLACLYKYVTIGITLEGIRRQSHREKTDGRDVK